MSHLSLVKSLSHLQEEQRHSEELLLETIGLSLERGAVSEISGASSSGKTSITLMVMAKLTSTGEICAVVDSGNSFDPCAAVLAGVELDNLLWVKCGGDIEKAFISADNLVQAKGFGAIWLNLSGTPERLLKMVPSTYWYRYRTRIRDTPTLMIVTAREHVTGSASQQSFIFSRERTLWSGNGRFKLLREFRLNIRAQKRYLGSSSSAQISMDYRDI